MRPAPANHHGFASVRRGKALFRRTVQNGRAGMHRAKRMKSALIFATGKSPTRELMAQGLRLGENNNWIPGFCRYYGQSPISRDRAFDRVEAPARRHKAETPVLTTWRGGGYGRV